MSPELVVGARDPRAATTTPGQRLRRERGAVSAETAAVLPVLALVALGLVWLLSVAAAQVEVVDVAREVARAAAREDGSAAGRPAGRLGPGRAGSPDRGLSVAVQRSGSSVTVVVSRRVPAPSLLRFLPAASVSAEAVAAREPS